MNYIYSDAKGNINVTDNKAIAVRNAMKDGEAGLCMMADDRFATVDELLAQYEEDDILNALYNGEAL